MISCLKRNLALNCPFQPINVIEGAISYGEDPQVSFSIHQNPICSKVDNDFGPLRLAVPSITLSGILRNQLVDNYVLISDVEGMEVDLFLHDSEGLAKCQLLIIELHRTRNSSKLFEVDDIIALIHDVTHFRLQARHGAVCVFIPSES